jgi:hypothetical protein
MTALVLSPAELHGIYSLIIQREIDNWCQREPSHLSELLNCNMGSKTLASKCKYSKGKQNTQNTRNFQV